MSFRRTFVTGLLVVLPVVLTFWVVGLIFDLVEDSITPYVLQMVRWYAPAAQSWAKYVAPLISFSTAVGLVYLVGLLGGNVLGRQALRFVENLLLHVPVVRSIYSSSRQFIDTFSRSKGRAFSRVVLVEFPRPGAWSIGLVEGETRGEVRARLDAKLARPLPVALTSVFVPTTPNPTGGYLVFVPNEQLIPLDMSIDDALKMIISCGVLTPEIRHDRAAAVASVAAPVGSTTAGASTLPAVAVMAAASAEDARAERAESAALAPAATMLGDRARSA